MPFAHNARTHSANQIEQIAGFMRQFGVTSPILRDEAAVILAGHASLDAASLNREPGDDRLASARQDRPGLGRRSAPSHRRQPVRPSGRLGLRPAGRGSGALYGAGFDLGVLFSEGDLRRLGGLGGLTDPDAILPPEGLAVAQPGDLWLLVPPRVLCGSATHAGNVGTDAPRW